MHAAREPLEPLPPTPAEAPDPHAPISLRSPAAAEPTPLDPAIATPHTVAEDEHVIELKEEQLVARKRLVEAGEVVIHTEIDESPARLEVDAFHEEIEVEHVPQGKVVTERVAPWEEDGDLIVPVYEEQLVVVKRLVLKEHVRVRRVRSWERQLFEESVRKERLVVEEPPRSAAVREQYPAAEEPAMQPPYTANTDHDRPEADGFLTHLVRKALQ
jgi:uncharacterized protein (TIGR02271 family)